MLYPAVKHVHVACVIVSFTLFWWRGLWVLSGRSLPEHWLPRSLPHLVDTILLTSALWLTTIIGQYPFSHAWLSAKVAGLVVYVALGWYAVKADRPPGTRAVAFAAAACVFAYIVTVARTHNPLGFLSLI